MSRLTASNELFCHKPGIPWITIKKTPPSLFFPHKAHWQGRHDGFTLAPRAVTLEGPHSLPSLFPTLTKSKPNIRVNTWMHLPGEERDRAETAPKRPFLPPFKGHGAGGGALCKPLPCTWLPICISLPPSRPPGPVPPRPPGAPAWPTAPPSPRSRTDTAPSAAPRPGGSWPRPPAPAAGPAPSRSCACAAPRPPCATGNGVRRRPPGRSPATHLCAGDGGPGRGRLSPAARSQAVAPPLSAAQPGRGPGAAPLSTAAAALAWQPFLRLALLLSGVPHARAWGMDALSPGCGDLSVPGFAPFCQDSCLLLLPRLSASVYSPRSWAGLSPAGRQAPTKAAPSLPASAGQGREGARKGSWVERRTGRQHSPTTVTGKTDSTRANDLNLLPSTSE